MASGLDGFRKRIKKAGLVCRDVPAFSYINKRTGKLVEVDAHQRCYKKGSLNERAKGVDESPTRKVKRVEPRGQGDSDNANGAAEQSQFRPGVQHGSRRFDLLGRDVPIQSSFQNGESLKAGIQQYWGNAFIDDELLELADPNDFHELIGRAQKENKFGSSVEVKSLEEYGTMRLFTTPDGRAGLALTHDGDLVSGFSFPDKEKPRRLAQLLALGIKEGATKADSFNTVLPDYYTKFGFKPTSRLKFNDEFAPDNWDYELYKGFNGGRPDVVFYAWDGGNREDIDQRIGHFGELKNLLNVAIFEKDDYAGAAKAQADAVKSIAKSGTDCVTVKGYTRKSGTRVKSYQRCNTREEYTALKVVIEKAISEGKTTLDLYEGNEEREALREKLVNREFEFIDDANPVGKKIFLLGGAPANGKSTYLNSPLSEVPRTDVLVSADDLKSGLPEYNFMLSERDPRAAAFVHDESSMISKRIINKGIDDGYSVTIDAISDDGYERLKKKISTMKRNGHEVIINYVSLDSNLSLKLARARGERTGRYVPEEYIKYTNKEIPKIVPRAIQDKLFDKLTLWDTNELNNPREIVRFESGEVVSINKELWLRFLKKGGHANVKKYADLFKKP